MSDINEVRRKTTSVSKIQKMTVERLKTFQGFETYTDQKAKQVIEELEKYAKIILEHISNHKKEQHNTKE